MTRPLLLVPALAAALLIAAPAAAEERSASVKFPLRASHGLRAYVEADDDGIKLNIGRKGRSVTYQLEGQATQAGLTARFGRLGLIDVAFETTKTLRTIEPPAGCTGEPAAYREGIFTGTIEFTGERRYVRIDQARAKGRMHVGPAAGWECITKSGWLPSSPRASTSAAGKRKAAKEETAALFASSKRCGCYFVADAIFNRDGRDSVHFVGAKFEWREGMQIIRATGAGARPAAFAFDHATGVAKVSPPKPFTGHGIYKRRPHRRDLWRSSVRVPLLGAKPLRLHGRGFRATLVREYPSR